VSLGPGDRAWRRFGFGLWAPWWVVASPSHAFDALRASRPLLGVTIGIAVATAAAGGLSAPVLIDGLRNTPELGASPSLANAVVLIQTGIVGPVGVTVFLLVMGAVIWTICAVAGFATDFSMAAVVAVVAGVTGVLHKTFVSAVLYLRLMFRPDRVMDDVPSGIGAFLNLDSAPGWLAAVVDHLGVFDVWYAILLAMGVEICLRLPRRQAWTCAAVSFALVTTAKVMTATLVR